MNVNVSLDALAAFQAVATHGSFTRAAASLHVTQGAVSHRVRDLERQLGYPLFVRTTRDVALTEEGAMLSAGVARGLAAIEDAFAAIERRRNTHTLAVSCSPSFAIRFLMRQLHAFREAHPRVAIRIAASDDLGAPGDDGIDVCIRYGAGRYPGAQVTRLTHEEVFPVASPSLLERTPLRREGDLVDHVLVHHDVMRDHPDHLSWSRWLSARTKGAIDTEAGLHFSHAHMALEAALAGEGVALGRTTLVRDDLRAGRLVAPLRRRKKGALAYWFLARPGRNPRVAAFRSWLIDALASGA